jgi:hypothetical protein
MQFASSYPTLSYSHQKKVEGYWRGRYEPDKDLPSPELFNGTPTEEYKKFVKTFSDMKYVSPFPEMYMGYSYCRICNMKNGSGEYNVDYKGCKVYYTEGLLHYYQEHNVLPSEEFYRIVMSFQDEIKENKRKFEEESKKKYDTR